MHKTVLNSVREKQKLSSETQCGRWWNGNSHRLCVKITLLGCFKREKPSLAGQGSLKTHDTWSLFQTYTCLPFLRSLNLENIIQLFSKRQYQRFYYLFLILKFDILIRELWTFLALYFEKVFLINPLLGFYIGILEKTRENKFFILPHLLHLQNVEQKRKRKIWINQRPHFKWRRQGEKKSNH